MTRASSQARFSELMAEDDLPPSGEWGVGSERTRYYGSHSPYSPLPTPLLAIDSLQLFNPRHDQHHSNGKQDNDRASSGHRPLRAVMSPAPPDQVGQRADQQSSHRRQPDESQRVHAHHASAHLVLHQSLQQRVDRGRDADHSGADQREEET